MIPLDQPSPGDQVKSPAAGYAPPELPLSPAEERLLANVDPCLADGIALLDWWRQAEASGGFSERFELSRVFNRPDTGYSFFAEAPIPSGRLPVMGDVPWVFYDQTKGRDVGRWNREVREFALRYFMRISDFRLPQVVTEGQPKPPPAPLDLLSFCPPATISREGFGYEQLFYKLRGSGGIGRFPPGESFAIIDQRELFERYEWVVANVQIFDFALSFPLDPSLPRFELPLPESQLVILHRAFVEDDAKPSAGCVGRYQFGYAMLRAPDDDSILAYGPGRFDAGFQLFTFTVADDSQVRVRMPFVVNRPRRILDLSLDPLDWALRGARLVDRFLGSAETASWLASIQQAAARLPFRPGGFDPVTTGITLANLLTLGQASARFCISKADLEKFFLIFHFNQYYTMITSSLLTWRQIPDWLDSERIPEWVKSGVSS